MVCWRGLGVGGVGWKIGRALERDVNDAVYLSSLAILNGEGECVRTRDGQSGGYSARAQ
jgi:hypothetical protein